MDDKQNKNIIMSGDTLDQSFIGFATLADQVSVYFLIKLLLDNMGYKGLHN